MVERSLSMREVRGSIPRASTIILFFLAGGEFIEQRLRQNLHRPGIEPGPPAWQASILPLNQRCLFLQETKCGQSGNRFENVKGEGNSKTFFLRSR